MTAAYSVWSTFIVAITLANAMFATDSYSFQFLDRDLDPGRARHPAGPPT